MSSGPGTQAGEAEQDQPTADSSSVASTQSGKRQKRRKWPWITVVSIVVVLFLVWAAANCYGAYWVAHNGVISQSEPSVSQLGFPATNVHYAKGLVAWYTPPKPGKPVLVIVHGYQANRSHVLPTARAMYPFGYGLLLPNLGYVSGKALYGGGDREANEVIQAVNYAIIRSHAPVVLIGYSEGGAEAILAADRHAKVIAVISDSAPVSFLNIATQKSGVPSWLLAGVSIVYPWFSSGGHLEDLSNILPDDYHVPTLIIQGTADTTVPYSNGPELAKLTHGSLWTVQGAGHDEALALDPTLYVKNLNAFIDHALAGSRRS